MDISRFNPAPGAEYRVITTGAIGLHNFEVGDIVTYLGPDNASFDPEVVIGRFANANGGEQVLGLLDLAPLSERIEPTHYVIGLPVAITVHPNGAVTLDVDLSEASDLDEDEEAVERYGDEVVEADRSTVSAAAARLAHTLTFTLNPTNAQEAS